MTKVKWRNRS